MAGSRGTGLRFAWPAPRGVVSAAGRACGRARRVLAVVAVASAVLAGAGAWDASAASPHPKPQATRAAQVRALQLGRHAARDRVVPMTVPGTPGVPQAGTQVYYEDFQNVAGGASPAISSYTGAAPAANQTYIADPAWDGRYCNGWVMSATSAAPADPCMSVGAPVWGTTLNGLRAMGIALGVFQGQTTAEAQGNYANAEFTGTGTVPGVELQTSPNNIPAVTGHYYIITADFGAVDYNGGGAGCDASDPSLRFSLLDGTTLHTLATGLDPCTAPGNRVITVTSGGDTGNIRVAQLVSSAYQWTGGPTMGIQLYNANGAAGGNDSAFDAPTVVDVTPQLDKSFTPASVPAGGTSTLTFTVTNTSELAAKDGWSFTDTLPAGMTVTGTASTTCPNATLTAPAGATSVQMTGDLDQGMASCTVSVPVTSPTVGELTNGPGNITASSGLNPPGSSSVTFAPNTLTVSKALNGTRLNPGDQFTVAIRSGSPTGPVVNPTTDSTTTGSGSAVDVGTGTTGTTTVTAGSPYYITEAAAGTTDLTHYTATITCTDGSGSQAGLPAGAAFSGSLAYTPTPRPPVSCVITNTPNPAPALAVVKAAPSAEVAAAGDVIGYSYIVTNTGNTTLTGITVSDTQSAPAGALDGPVTCPQPSLAPGASETCTATYTLTQADVDNGSVSDTATATGTPPSGPAVTSPPSAATVPVPAGPAVNIVKSATPAQAHKPGDQVTYRYTVTNTGTDTLTNVTVSDTMTAPASQANLSPVTCPDTTLAPGASTTCTATYTVTQADVDNGSVGDSAAASATPPSGPAVSSPQAAVTVPIPAAPALTVAKSTTTAKVTRAGQVIPYSFDVTNAGNVTLTHVTVTDSVTPPSDPANLSPVTCPATPLAPGASETCTATYTVTQADVDHGKVSDSAAVTGTPPATPSDPSPSPLPPSPVSAVSVPVAQHPGIDIVKEVASPATAPPGGVIHFRFTVKNTGNVTLTQVKVSDPLLAAEGITVRCPRPALAPGESELCVPSAPYVVPAAATAALTSGTGPVTLTAFVVPSAGTVTLTSAVAGPRPAAGGITVRSRSRLGTGAPQAQTQSAAYALTSAGGVGGTVVNTATASARTPSGQIIHSQPSTVTVRVTPAVVIPTGEGAGATAPGASPGLAAAGAAALAAGAVLLLGRRRRVTAGPEQAR